MTQFHGTIKAGAPLTEEQNKARRKDIPAFPVNKYEGSWVDGMGLRDYFAAKAMQALLENNWEGLLVCNQEETNKVVFAICDASYAVSDAMMKARETK